MEWQKLKREVAGFLLAELTTYVQKSITSQFLGEWDPINFFQNFMGFFEISTLLDHICLSPLCCPMLIGLYLVAKICQVFYFSF